MSKYGFQTKLFGAYSAFIALLIFVSFYTFYWVQSKSMEKIAVDNQSQLTVKTSEQVEALIREMDNISLQIVYNPLLTQMIEDAFHDKDHYGNYFEQHLDIGRQARDIVASINGPNLTVSRISLFNPYGDYLSSGTIPENEDVIRQRLQSEYFRTEYKYMKEFEGRVFLSLPHEDYWSGESDELFSLIREFRSVYDSYGMIEVQQPYDLLAKTLNMENLPDTEVLLLNEKGEKVYGNTDLTLNLAELRAKADEAKAVEGAYFKLEETKGMSEQLVTFREMSNVNWMMYLVTDENKLLEPIRSLGKLLIFLSLGLFFSALFVVFIITRQLTLPLKKLRNSVRSVSINNLSIDLGNDDAGHNELILLNRAFNKMFERLRMSMQQVIEAKSAEADARFHALQSQMNPHFMYNVLSVISAAGQQAGVTKVMELCHKLSMMLRYITSYKSGNVTIQKECEYAELYLELMKERYEEFFEYELVIDDAVQHVGVPRLILQPLIENCFHHAFQSVSPPWRVRVQIGRAPEPANQWMMRIEDNGSGFDPILLERLLAQIKQLDTGFSVESDGKEGGVGLMNTIVRLKLLYADKAIVTIEPRSPRGTIVTIGGTLHD